MDNVQLSSGVRYDDFGTYNMPSELMHYLDETFPGLQLNPPLFYRWPIALRFDLGGRASTPNEQDEVLNRAATLFSAAFREDDSCIVVAQDWPAEHRSPWVSYTPTLFEFSQGNPIGLRPPAGQVEAPDPEEPEVGPCTLTWVEQPVRQLRYELVLEAIANADHSRQPAISSRVYWINRLSNIILYMYDDRGLDLIGKTKDALGRFYRDFNSWILEYDRVRIDQTFSS